MWQLPIVCGVIDLARQAGQRLNTMVEQSNRKVISIVIRCYNEERYIGRLLDGICQQGRDDIELIIVDSGSTDATVEIVSQYPVKLLTIRPEDFSFGRSLNIGCQAATGDFIVIASAHVYPTYKDWLEGLLAPFSDPDVALVYGKQSGNEITKFSEGQVLAKWFPDKSNNSQEHPFCNNANSAIRRTLWEQLPYDESLTGLEDLDWARRAIDLGYKIAYAANAEIIHVHNESAKQTYNRYRREAIALKTIYSNERFNLWHFARFLTANLVNDYRQALHDGAFRRNIFSIFGFRLMQFWGTFRGFAQSGPVTNQLKQTFYYPNSQTNPPESSASTNDSSRRVEYSNDTAEHPVDGKP